MTITVPKLNKHTPIAPSIRMHYSKQWTWRDHLQELELKYNSWGNTYMASKYVNDIMQVMYPGPYRVVEKYLSDRMIFEFSLEFDDPHEYIIWLLKNS